MVSSEGSEVEDEERFSILAMIDLRPSWLSSGLSARPSSKLIILSHFSTIASGVSLTSTGKP